MKDDTEGFGLSKKEAEENLKKISPLYLQKMERLIALRTGPSPNSEEVARLEADAKALEARMLWIRDWYSLGVWESVENESRRLRRLTFGLLLLTGVLAVLTAVLVWRTFI